MWPLYISPVLYMTAVLVSIMLVHVIMQGTIIALPFFAFFRSSGNWEEADLFRPERFLEKDAEVARRVGGAKELSPESYEPADKATGQNINTLFDSELRDRYHNLANPHSRDNALQIIT
jgi:hypothetical protein